MENIKKVSDLLKKHRISIIAVLAFVVAISCICIFSSGEPEELPEEVESEVVNRVGEAIYVDGSLVAAFDTIEEAEAVLAEALSNRVETLGIAAEYENDFDNEIEIVNGEYPEEAFIGSEAASLITETVYDYNGELLPVKMIVRSVGTFNKNVVIEHESKTIFTDMLANGVVNVLIKGYDGEGVETYSVTAIDGVEMVNSFVSLEVTSPAVNQVTQIGTRSDGKDIASLGLFSKPFDGIITSYMGPRWGRVHSGIDIWSYDCYGKPAFAAADGVVISSENMGSYGNCVIIDHGNGIRTLYAHFSQLAVPVGTYVSEGDVVGYIGTTGNTTGPHLHFEVIVDGERTNPLIFVDYE